jgi:hypothetical protein
MHPRRDKLQHVIMKAGNRAQSLDRFTTTGGDPVLCRGFGVSQLKGKEGGGVLPTQDTSFQKDFEVFFTFFKGWYLLSFIKNS